MKNYNLTIAAIIIIAGIFIQSCTEEMTTPKEQAKAVTVSELKSTYGFTWFEKGYESYNPDTSITNKIKEKLTNSELKFYVFVNPSCACTGTQVYFPASIKILNYSGAYEPQFQIYTMSYAEVEQPYTSIFKIRELPALMIIKNNTAIYSVFDTITAIRQTNQEVKIEEILLKGLSGIN